MQKKLVAYFSATGVTRKAAQALAAAAGADIYEIRPKTPYTKADLDWTDKKSRPALADTGAHVADYDVVFVGFPIWWYVAPTIINTFLESYDFSGKTIVLFATSGGSGFGKTLEGLRASVSDTAALREGRLLNGRISERELSAWVDGLNL